MKDRIFGLLWTILRACILPAVIVGASPGEVDFNLSTFLSTLLGLFSENTEAIAGIVGVSHFLGQTHRQGTYAVKKIKGDLKDRSIVVEIGAYILQKVSKR